MIEQELYDEGMRETGTGSSAFSRKPSFGLRFQGLQLSGFQRNMITGSRCEGFLPMKCVFHNDRTDIFYDTEGYVCVNEALKNGGIGRESVMSLCIGFLEVIRICGDYLLSVEDLSFQDERIFCTEDFSEIRLMYVPGYRNERSVRSRLTDLIDTAIEYDEKEEDIIFFSEYKKRLYTEGKDLPSMTRITEEMMRKQFHEVMIQENKEQEAFSERIKRMKGTPVKWSGTYSGIPDAGRTGGGTELLREESSHYGNKRNKKNRQSDIPGIGKRLKNLIDGLVQ